MAASQDQPASLLVPSLESLNLNELSPNPPPSDGWAILDALGKQMAKLASDLTHLQTYIEGRFINLEGKFDYVRSEVVSIHWRLSAYEAARMNSGQGNGRAVPYRVIPFPDGSMPGDAVVCSIHEPIVTFKLLRKFSHHCHIFADDVWALSETQINRYLRAYYPGEVPGGASEARGLRQLMTFIGCTTNPRA